MNYYEIRNNSSTKDSESNHDKLKELHKLARNKLLNRYKVDRAYI